MNLPMGLSALFEIGVKKKEETAATRQDVHVEYKDKLEYFMECIHAFSDKLDHMEKQSEKDKLSTVQTAIDLTYMKELGDKTLDTLSQIQDGPINKTLSNIEELTVSMTETNFKIGELDKNLVNRLTELLEEQQKQSMFQNKQLQTELLTSLEGVAKSIKKGRIVTGLLFFFNLISLSGVIFLILYILEIISF